ncbi:MAG: rRNA maturation RNase YbeY [bacterium]
MISVAFQYSSRRITKKETQRIVCLVLSGEEVKKKSISVVYVGNKYMQRMNRRFLNHNYPTDVIAFPLDQDQGIQGELYVNIERVSSQAKEFGVTILNELRRLLIHGTLHLSGYSDTDVQSKARMTACENKYLAQLEKKAREHARKNY